MNNSYNNNNKFKYRICKFLIFKPNNIRFKLINLIVNMKLTYKAILHNYSQKMLLKDKNRNIK